MPSSNSAGSPITWQILDLLTYGGESEIIFNEIIFNVSLSVLHDCFLLIPDNISIITKLSVIHFHSFISLLLVYRVGNGTCADGAERICSRRRLDTL